MNVTVRYILAFCGFLAAAHAQAPGSGQAGQQSAGQTQQTQSQAPQGQTRSDQQAQAQTTAALIQLVSPKAPVIAIDRNGNGSITVMLTNPSAQPVALNAALVGVTDFYHDQGTRSYPLNAQATVTGLPATAPSRTPFPVKVAVTQVWETGDSTAELKIAEAVISRITARREPVPFGIQLDGQNPEVTFAPEVKPSITLVNGDHASYAFTWSLILPDQTPTAPHEASIPPNGKLRLDLSSLNPQPGFLNSGTLRDYVCDAILELQPQTGTGLPPQAAKQLPVKVRVRWGWPYWQQVFNIFFVALLVLTGMGASLMFHYFLPNAAAAVRLRRQLEELRQRVRGMSDDLPSQPRTVLESTLAGCCAQLKSIPMPLPAFATVAAEVKASADMCTDWVDCAYWVADVLGEARRQLQSGFPPTLMRLIEDRCDHALRPFLSGFTAPAEIQTMKVALDDARKFLDAGVEKSPIPALESIIKDREARITTCLEDLKTRFPKYAGLFQQFLDSVKDGADLRPQRYRDRDVLSQKIDLLLQFRELELRVGAKPVARVMAAAATAGASSGGDTGSSGAGSAVTPEGGVTGPSASGDAGPSGSGVTSTPAGGDTAEGKETALDRLGREYDRFLSFVDTESYESLQMARIYIAEMQQDIYAPALVKELKEKDPPALQIHARPSPIEPGVPVHYSLRFDRDALNKVAAVREWSVRWTFHEVDDESGRTKVVEVKPPLAETETGWDIYHRFPNGGTHKVAVNLVDYDGKVVPSSKPIEITVDMQVERESEWDRWTKMSAEGKVELLRFSFVLVITLVGVFASARTTVEKLGIFEGAAALVGVGFAADVAKNLLTEKPGETK